MIMNSKIKRAVKNPNKTVKGLYWKMDQYVGKTLFGNTVGLKHNILGKMNLVENSSFKNQVEVIHSDFLLCDFTEKFDLIVSNPPFFEKSLKSSGKVESEQKNLARHTESLPFESLLKKVSDLLKEEGDFWIILPVNAADKLILIANHQRLYLKDEIAVYGKPNLLIRKIVCFSRIPIKHSTSSLLIRVNNNDYSEDYKLLTIDFHNRKL